MRRRAFPPRAAAGVAACGFAGLGWRPFLPVRDRPWIEGRYDGKGRQLHITRGVGTLHGLRFNCRPETSLLVAGEGRKGNDRHRSKGF